MKSLLKALFIKGLVQFGISTGLKSKAPKYLLMRTFAGLLLLVAGIFLLIAGHQILRAYFALPIVNLIFAAGFVLLALIILLTVAILRKKHQRKSPIEAPMRAIEHLGDQAQEQAKQIGSRAQSAIRGNAGKFVAGVAIASLILGWRSGRKK